MTRHPGDNRLSGFVGRLGRSHVPPLPPDDGPPRSPRRLEVFGTGPDWLQVTWSRLGPGPVTVRAGDARADIQADGGPGSVLLDGLPPAQRFDIVLDGEGIPEPTRLRATTLARPPGDELFRLATISDVHVGSRSTGYFHTITEVPEPDVPHPLRCLRSAVDELRTWGAQHLVVKGDLVDLPTPENWAAARDVVAGLRVPIDLIPGNHELSKGDAASAAESARRVGLRLVRGVQILDRPGVRLIVADTTRTGTDKGDIVGPGDRIVAAAARARTPVFVGLHHQLMRFAFPTYLPPGIPGPEANQFLVALGAANPRTLVSSGHTHRHRRRSVGPVTVTEVGSTKDFPGSWAGYQFFEGGVVQTVRRIGEPSCIRWTDHTRRAAAGVWQLWSPGRLEDRCFSRTW